MAGWTIVGIIVSLFFVYSFYKFCEFLHMFFSFNPKREAREWQKDALKHRMNISIDTPGNTTYCVASTRKSGGTNQRVINHWAPLLAKIVSLLITGFLLCLLLPFLKG